TLQQQVKNNDDIINNSNEEFEPPVPNAIMKMDLSSQLERQTSYATTGVFPNGYLCKSYPAEARPKMGDQVIALVGTDAPNIYGKVNYDANNDGKIDIMDTWNVNGKGQFEAQSYVKLSYKFYETIVRLGQAAEELGQNLVSKIWEKMKNFKQLQQCSKV
ncbi:MAG: hypothetical protein EZS28_040476, partial [Streblomastix strix]